MAENFAGGAIADLAFWCPLQLILCSKIVTSVYISPMQHSICSNWCQSKDLHLKIQVDTCLFIYLIIYYLIHPKKGKGGTKRLSLHKGASQKNYIHIYT